MQGRVTNGLRVGWVAPLAFYEQKLETLKRLEHSGDLHQFFVKESDTGARVGDQHHELRVGVRGILAVIYPPEETAGPVIDAVEDAFHRISPTSLRSLSIFTQHVYELQSEYDDARSFLARYVAGPFAQRSGADAGVVFEHDSDIGHVHYQYGVVNRDELSDMLLGGAGAAHPPRDVLSVRRLPSELPRVSFYLEANHVVAIPQELDDPGRFVLDIWRRSLQDADESAEALLGHYHGMAERQGRGAR